jgi:hypothetical protein
MGPCTKSGTAAGWEKGGPKAGYGGFISIAGSTREESGKSGGCDTHRWLAGDVFAVVTSWCRQVGAVQGARLHHGHCTGTGLAELRCGDGLLLLVLALLLFLFFSSAGAVTGEGENKGLLGFGERLGLLYSALGFGERLQPGVLDIQAGTRGGITAVQRGLVADTGGATVSLPCHGARDKWGAAQAGYASEQGPQRKGKEKRRRSGWALFTGRSERGEVGRAAGVSGKRRKGKLTSRPHLSAAPGGR